MQQTTPFIREAGAGPGVVCLHSNTSSSSQWRALMECLAPKYHALAPDSYGAGKSPTWPADRDVRLRDEAALLEPVFARAGEPFALVGHSYGGAVALIAALAQPQRVRALALYEPTLFALVDAESPPAMRTAQPGISSISGWARAPGRARQRLARAPSPIPSSMSAAGRARCSGNRLRWRLFPH